MKITAYVPENKYLYIVYKDKPVTADATMFDARSGGKIKDVYVLSEMLEPTADEDQTIYQETEIDPPKDGFVKFTTYRKLFPNSDPR